MEMGKLAAGTAIFSEGHTNELKVLGRIFHTVTSAAGTGMVTPSRQPPWRGGLVLMKKSSSRTSLVVQLSGICRAMQGMWAGSLVGELRPRMPRSN